MTEIEMDIQQAVLKEDGKGSVFVLRYDAKSTTGAMLSHCKNSWDDVWKRAGWEAPALIMMPTTMELQALTDDELRKVGLCRVKTYEIIRDETEAEPPGFS